MTSVVLVADIGGTNTRIAPAREGQIDVGAVTKYRNADHPHIEDILSLEIAKHAPTQLCIALAGPIQNGVGSMTNLPWVIDPSAIQQTFDLRGCFLLNDLQAQAWAISTLHDDTLETWVDAPRRADGTALVFNIGTGCNIAVQHVSEQGRFVPPAEAGHSDLTVKSEQEFHLRAFLAAEYGEPSVEGLLSGRGLVSAYHFFGGAAGTEPAQIINECRADRTSIAAQAVDIVLKKLADCIGDHALIHMPVGGIYLVGGVIHHLAEFKDDRFDAAFYDKGRFGDFMRQFAVMRVRDDLAALKGCYTFLRSQPSR